jgi:hypothetical protein
VVHDYSGSSQYLGDALTDDVPLIDKMQAIDFIADDWTQYSNQYRSS